MGQAVLTGGETAHAGGETQDLIVSLYETFLSRPPSDAELSQWTRTSAGQPAHEILRRFVAAPAIRSRRGVSSFWTPGHYYSPLVDPATVRPYVERARADPSFEGIHVDRAAMQALFLREHHRLAGLGFAAADRPGARYRVDGSPFPAGDAASLYLMLSLNRPRRIVEIGSGFSTAAMLDFAELLKIEPLFIRAIEPYPDRLRALMRPGDDATVTIVEKLVQDVPVEQAIGDLTPGDILFIDSTHVLKTGSDVHYELFSILPRVPPGVLVHLHDCPYPFEYPDFWIFERNYSWNEVYALRAFLMYNDAFRIVFWAGLLKAEMGGELARLCPHYEGNPGSSIWLERVR